MKNFWYHLGMNVYHIVGALVYDFTHSNPPTPEDAWMTPGERALRYGYHFEKHKIETEDGYILTAFRIPGKLEESQEEHA